MPIGDRYSSANSGEQPTITRTVTKQIVPFESGQLVDPDVVQTKKHEEWITNKRVVNHKIKQVETRVQRQLILEDGIVVADSGPQVTTKTTEDVRVEETENTQHKTTGDDPPGAGYVVVPGSAKVVSEKTESTQTVTETKEENKQLHDENFKDLSGEELHQRIVVAPDNLGLVGNIGEPGSEYPGTLTHFSSRSQKVVDKEEVKEVSELKDGELTTETTRTHHHEEAYDDEVPEDECEEGAIPERSAETSRTLQYYTDPKEFNAVAEKLQQESRRSQEQVRNSIGTNRWLADNFGLESGSENTRTKAGGNKITIEMSAPRSTPSDLSPRDRSWNRETRDSVDQHAIDRTSYRKEWQNTINGRSPSPPYPSSTLNRSQINRTAMSPAGVSSSSGSSRSKTPVKTFYLGEDDSYVRDSQRWKSTPPLANVLKSSLSNVSPLAANGISNTSHYSTYGGSEQDYIQRKSSSLNRSFDSDQQLQRHTYRAKPIYTKIHRSKSDKNIQVSMSDDEEDVHNFSRSYKDEQYSSYNRADDRGTMTLLRNSGTKMTSSAGNQSTLASRSRIKHSKSSEVLSAPSSRYSPPIDYDYAEHRRSASPNRISPRNQNWKSRTEVHDVQDKNEYNYTNSYNTHVKQNEVKSSTRNNYTNSYSSYPRQNGQERSYQDYSLRSHRNSDYNEKSSNDRHYKNYTTIGGRSTEYSSQHRKSKISNSPIYRSSPSPSSSPPPRLIKVLNSDHYGSSSSLSPPDSPLHHTAHWTPSRGRSSGYSSTSRSKSSGDLRSPQLVSPTSYSPMASPSDTGTRGSKADRHQKYYRVKPGNDGKSVVVQVREWNGR